MTAASLPAPDPYEPRPTLWERHGQLGWVLAVFALTVVLTYISFPPVSTGEAAYTLAVPALLWAYRRPPFRVFAWTVLGAQVVAWSLLLGWLHNVTWAGVFIVGAYSGLITGVWYLAAWWTIPRLAGHQAMVRILGLLGLAALWVVLEWVRSILFGGFPWLPLAASQWQRPLILQGAAYAGAGAVSFILIFFNLAGAAYTHRIFFEGATGLRKRSPEFMVALTLLVSSSFTFLPETMGPKLQKLARIAFVQPYIPQNEKWDAARASEVMHTIEKVTFAAGDAGAPDFIFWPEAVTPWALYRGPQMQEWLEAVARQAGRPLLLGSVYTERPGLADEQWYNGAFIVDPRAGLANDHYAKRKLVPFGEYIPLRPVFGWLEKVAGIGGDLQRGDSARPLILTAGGRQLAAGVLICYEDIFPGLARDSVRSGADVLVVLTNNGWFGEGGAAYQHAANSVLRAVETRRPVLRCGNGGWSGWIDEFGNIRATLHNEAGSVYFRGFETLSITRDLRWRDRQSFYTEHGDWFLLACALLSVAVYYLVFSLHPPRPRADGETVF